MTAKNFIVRLLTEYSDSSQESDQGEETKTFTIVDDVDILSDVELDETFVSAKAAFEAIYSKESDLSDLSTEDLENLQALAAHIEALSSEKETRDGKRAERAEMAKELAKRVNFSSEDAVEEDSNETEVAEAEVEETEVEENKVEEVKTEEVASAHKVSAVRYVSSLASKKQLKGEIVKSVAAPVITSAVSEGGKTAGQALTWDQAGELANDRLARFGSSKGMLPTPNQPLVNFKKNLPETIQKEDSPREIYRKLRSVGDESKLPGGSLIASGGWCAPSETIYDMCELETAEGILRNPQIGVSRGGFKRTLGPSFSEIFEKVGFHYTEAQDIAGNYDGNGGGEKACYTVECPTWEEFRLDIVGVCITAGLLQSRGYPEIIARTLRGALIAHEHKMAAISLQKMVAGSTAINAVSKQAGTLAPILDVVSLQVAHMREVNRLSDSQTIELVLPKWVLGAIRSDLALRNGVDMIDISDAYIKNIFAQRGVAVQFVYNLNGIASTPAANFTAWPTSTPALLYPSGTWVDASADVVTMGTTYFPEQAKTNDYTALFTEEGVLTAKMCHDSRVLDIGICVDGVTSAPAALDCTGSKNVAPQPQTRSVKAASDK